MRNRTTKREHRSGTRGVREEARHGPRSQVQEQRPINSGQREPSAGPGMAATTGTGPSKDAGTNPKYANAKRRNVASSHDEGAPTDTGTPGGGLGAPDEAELKRDPEETSEKSDTRTETER